MTEPTRGARARRGNRKPGSLLLTALLVLAIVASSALVFTNKVELLKLAVIIALWAAVVAAFVSFIYRRQADIDSAKSRDLKFVYDLQLEREISARREYELSVESQLRRELASELRAQASDEVASLRAELAALRANLEVIFDTDLQQRPAIETERTSVHNFGDWGAVPQASPAADRGDREPGRVISSRIDAEAQDDTDPNTEESPIIDVPAEPHPPEDDWAPLVPGGAHRRPSEPEPADTGWRPPRREAPVVPEEAPAEQKSPTRSEGRRRAPEPRPEPSAPPEARLPWLPPEPAPRPRPQQPAPAPAPAPAPQVQQPPSQPWPRFEPQRQEPERVARPAPTGSDWRPAPAEGQFIPAGSPGSNWASPAAPPAMTPPPPATPTMTQPPAEPPRGRHSTTTPTAGDPPRQARHSAPSESGDPGHRPPPPTLATPSQPPPQPTSTPEVPEPQPSRHRGPDEAQEPDGQHIGGQPVSELMARLQVSSTGGGRRRRREE